jgi:hypothetical protein
VTLGDTFIGTSYATGSVRTGRRGLVGGLVGNLGYPNISSNYWDVTTSGTKDGVGNDRNISGITGLSDAQLKAALPDGFDPAIWGQDPAINNGWPYLLANPPGQAQVPRETRRQPHRKL